MKLIRSWLGVAVGVGLGVGLRLGLGFGLGLGCDGVDEDLRPTEARPTYLPLSPDISPYLPISPPYLRPTEPRLLAVVIYLHVDVHLVRVRVRVRIHLVRGHLVRVRVNIDAHLPLQSSHRERDLFRG